MNEQTKERVKQVVGTPRWWLINGVIIALVIAVVAVVWPEDSAAAVPATVAAAAADPDPRLKRPFCGTTPQCKNWSKKKVHQFKKGRLGNAKGFKLPKKVRRMLDQKQARMHGRVTTRWKRNDDWWDFPAHAIRCLAYGTIRGGCDEAADIQNRFYRNTTRVAIVCGGSGVIGFVGKGGWWGFGRGTAGCLWTKWAGLW